MEMALNKINHIIHDAKFGMVERAKDKAKFLWGYLTALEERGDITDAERRMLMRFFHELTEDTVFLMMED